MQNAINVRLSDKQFHFVKEFAKDKVRTPEQILWLALTEYFESVRYRKEVCVYRDPADFSEEEKEKMARWDASEKKESEDYVQRTYDDKATEEIAKSFAQNILEGVQ